jgi:hypothetical protein
MPVYRYTKFIRFRYFGDSETLWTGNVDAPIARATIQAELTARNSCLPDSSSIEAIRIAEEGGLRKSILLTPQDPTWPAGGGPLNIPTTGAVGDNDVDGRFGEWRAILQQSLTLGTSQQSNRYVSGIPRGMTIEEGQPIPFASRADWSNPYNVWALILKNGQYYVRALLKPALLAPWLVIGLAPALVSGGPIGVVFNSATFGGTLTGARVHLYGFRPAKGTRAPTLNGTWYVDSVVVGMPPVPTVVYLRGSGGINPALQKFTDKTYLLNVLYGYLPITLVRTVRVGIHKRGKLSIGPRGRRLTRVSLDP